MNLTNQLPSFEAAFSNLHSSSLDLVEQEHQPDNSEQQPTYQGMPVRVLNPFPIYNRQSVMHPNEADPLDQYSLSLSLSETNYISNNDDLPESQLEELDMNFGSDDTASDELIFTEPDSHNAMHPPLRGSPCGETSVNISQSSLRPVALIRPLNAENQQEIQMETEGTVYSPLYMHQAISDNQATQAEVNVDDSPSLVERKRKRERERKRALRKDPAYAEGQKIYNKTYMRIIRKTSSKEEAKKQAVIARDQYLQSVNSAKNSGDLPLPSKFDRSKITVNCGLSGSVNAIALLPALESANRLLTVKHDTQPASPLPERTIERPCCVFWPTVNTHSGKS